MNKKANLPKGLSLFLLAGLLLAAFSGNSAFSSSGRFAPKPTKTPTRTPTRTPTLTNTPAPTGTPFTCTSWNLASDFRVYPNQENPNRDSCNNLGVWQFMWSTSLTRDPAAYFLDQYFKPNDGGINGLNIWQDADYDPYGTYPGIGYNATAPTSI